MRPWAEVIGQPIGHSLSPAIHRYWLDATGIEGAYKGTAVATPDLRSYLSDRRADTSWRGCNVTAPLKEAVLRQLDELDDAATAIGAVNCVHRDGSRLIGTNTDVDGIGEALAGLPIRGEAVAVIGAGGAARAAVHWLRHHSVGTITLVVRRPDAAQALGLEAAVYGVGGARRAFASASLIINATPLGLHGGEAMPAPLLDAVAEASAGAAFDMVYLPLETPFLRAAAASGARSVDGLTMLIGQARRSFALFFGADAPLEQDAKLRALIAPSAS